MLYICLDKNTKEPKGTVEIEEKALFDWEKKFIMKLIDESFRGKQPHELKFENDTVRLATQEEINDYFNSIKQETEIEKLTKRVEILEDKIK